MIRVRFNIRVYGTKGAETGAMPKMIYQQTGVYKRFVGDQLKEETHAECNKKISAEYHTRFNKYAQVTSELEITKLEKL